MQTTESADSGNGPGLHQARSRFGLLLGSVYRKWRRQVDLNFKDLGLSDATRMPLLALYVQAEPLRQKDLALALHLDTSSLVRVLAQLRESKMVDWACDPADKRAKCIALTPAGRQAAALIVAKSMEIEHAILADVTPQELQTTRQVLEKISQRFDAMGAAGCIDRQGPDQGLE